MAVDCSCQGLIPELACLPLSLSSDSKKFVSTVGSRGESQGCPQCVSIPSEDFCQSKEHFLNTQANLEPLDLKTLPFQC